MSALLDVESLSVAFSGICVVHDISFAIAPGETVALVGESGSGKSVTALSVMGLLPAGTGRATGRIAFHGDDLLAMSEAEHRAVRGARIGMIFQEPMTSLNPMLTIGRQMVEALEAHGFARGGDARSRAVTMLERVGIERASERMAQYPHEFSGGMRQRVMIAMTMALGPELLIADEPTTALDVTVQAQVLDLMAELARETGASLLLITHDMGVVAEMADRVVVMRHGRAVETGEVAGLFATPREDYTRELLAAVPRIDGPGREARPPAAPVLTFENVTRTFGGGFLSRGGETRAVDGVSLAVAPGETVALVGESGSGKSTLGRIGVGLERADAGSVTVDGHDITAARGRALRRLRSTIQMVFQDPFASLDPRFTAARTLMEPITIHAQGRIGRREARDRAAALIERVGLDADMLDRLPHEFSGGQRQRIAIARALAVEPDVIVLDEPTSALDVSVQARVLDLLIDLQTEQNLAYLFITHDLSVVRRIAHRVAVMRRGVIVEEGTTDAVLASPREDYTRTLINAAPLPDPNRRRRGRALAAGVRDQLPDQFDSLPDPFGRQLAPTPFGTGMVPVETSTDAGSGR